jgi:3-deoxy-D-manno-octulosonate 8-phosphate phosphatase KdsC-like HAD superfamily phosphatase
MKNIKWLFTDIDGVWTDCTIFYSAKGEEIKAFSYRDGMGAERLKKLTSIDIAYYHRRKIRDCREKSRKAQHQYCFYWYKK